MEGIEALGIELTEEMAVCLYTAISDHDLHSIIMKMKIVYQD